MADWCLLCLVFVFVFYHCYGSWCYIEIHCRQTTTNQNQTQRSLQCCHSLEHLYEVCAYLCPQGQTSHSNYIIGVR